MDSAKFQSELFPGATKLLNIENELHKRLTFLPAGRHGVQKSIDAQALSNKLNSPVIVTSRNFKYATSSGFLVEMMKRLCCIDLATSIWLGLILALLR